MRNRSSSPKSGDSRGAKGKSGSGNTGKSNFDKAAPKKNKSFSENRNQVSRSKKDADKGDFSGEGSTFSKKKFSTNERGFKPKPDSGKTYSKFKSDKNSEGGEFKPEFSKPRGAKASGKFGSNDSKSFSKFKSDKKSEGGEFKSEFSKPRGGRPTSKFSSNDSKPNSKFKTAKTKTDDDFLNYEDFKADKENRGGFKRKPLKKTKAFDTESVNVKPKKDSVLAESGIRLNKFISNSGVCSRREADVFIEQGVVKVNGAIVTELGYRVQPGDDVQFDGKHIRPEKPVYLLLNKPKDYLTSMADDRGRKTVMNLISNACKERVFPVGRLDRNTMGLLLFTNDGELADKLMHPRKSVKKIYMAELSRNFKEEHIDAIREGVVLEDGFFKPDVIEYVVEKGKVDKAKIGIEIHSGRNRIVRRLFEHFGYQVVKLDRVMYAGLTKKNILRGKWRFLEDKEIAHLKMM